MKLNELFNDACLHGSLDKARIIHIDHTQRNIHAIIDNAQIKNPASYYDKLGDNNAMHSLLHCDVISITFEATKNYEVIYFAVNN